MEATHYYEIFRQLDKPLKLITSPLLNIAKLDSTLALTKKSNCKTIAVFKITFKPGYEPKQEVYEQTN